MLTRYRASGETQRAFCEGAGVSVSTLQYWLQQERLTEAFSEVTPPTRTKTTLEFVFPLGALAQGLPPLSPLIGASPRLIDISGHFKSWIQFGCTLGFTSMIRGVTEI